MCSLCYYLVVGDRIDLKRAMKQLTLRKLPPVLILHLKRFNIGIIVTKNTNRVKYPEQVDVSPYCTEVGIMCI